MHSCSPKRAFTLIELLVVIAIIGILASLLLPSLAKAKRRARMVEEMNAGRQLMIGVQMYAEDNDGAMFPGYITDETAVDDHGQLLFDPENARYPWRMVPYMAGSMEIIYSGQNRSKLTQLQSMNHAAYTYNVSLFPSLGINSYFIGGNKSTGYLPDQVNPKFGAGTIVTKLSEARQPSDLMVFISARSAVLGNNADGYFEVRPPFEKTRKWAATYAASMDPARWGFVAPRFDNRSVAALLDGHVEMFGLQEMQDMRHWCNTADRSDFVLQQK
ncbi:MAG TPA: type II secretion system protein [Candidatus Limnocylindria bacterium]|nr:type II secretion system protein [Candidatus Limnocylindria bacterium]